jgi:hypothetical protein
MQKYIKESKNVLRSVKVLTRIYTFLSHYKII